MSSKLLYEEQFHTPRTDTRKNEAGPMLVYVVGAGHCGSTLLSLALDRHSDVLSVSEIVGLNAQDAGFAGGQDFREHGFWSRVAANYKRDFSGDFWSISFASPTRNSSISNAEWGNQNHNAFSSVAKTAGVSLIVDASKQPRRLEILLQEKTMDIRVIYLARDARAVVHSYDRKYKSMWRGFRQVKRLDRRVRSIRRRFPSIPWMTLRYEDMADDFEGTLGHVSEFCGIPFESNMLCPDTASFNGIGGNRLRQKPVRTVKADRTWEREMPAWKQALVALLLVGYQLRLGYPMLGRTWRKDCIE